MRGYSIALVAFAAWGAGSALGQQKAFPEAEGFGALARGGRGGDVYHVTSLQDHGAFQDHSAGSLIEQAYRLSFHHNLYAHNHTRNPKARVNGDRLDQLPPLGSGRAWDVSQIHTSGRVSVVPEPTVGAILTLLVIHALNYRAGRGTHGIRSGL